MLYKFFNVYPYYVINLALYLFAVEFILLIVMKCHIIWWCYVHILVFVFSRRWLNVYNFVFQRGGVGGSKAYFKVFHCVNLIILNFQGVSGPGERGGGQPWTPFRSAHACTFIWFWVTRELNSIIACNIGWSNFNKTGDD